MIKNTKIWLSILMASVMVLSMAACGKAPEEKPAEEAQAEATEEAQAEEPAEEPAETQEAAAETQEAEAETQEAEAAPLAPVVTYRDAFDTVTLSVPESINDKVTVQMPEADEDGIIFYVFENASAEAAAKLGNDDGGAGYLFSIGVTDQAYAEDLIAHDYPGVEVFAKDDTGNYYVFNHATDVRLVREDGGYTDEALADWEKLNTWAWSIQGTFIADNGLSYEGVEGSELTADTFANGYFRMIGGLEEGTAGSSLELAQAACDAMTFAAVNNLGARDNDKARDLMLEAWDSLTQEEQAAFDAHFMDVVMLMDSTVADWEANKGQFEDAGCGDKMEMLVGMESARTAWDRLKSNTLTLGNSDGE